MSTSVEKEILKTISYFNFFGYQPTFAEIYVFLSIKISKKQLFQSLDILTKKKVIFESINTLEEYSKNNKKYTLGRYGIEKLQITNYELQSLLIRQAESKKKLERIQPFINVLSKFSQIKLIGLSGSMAMMNAVKNDDVDLFIITKHNRLFTGRLISLLLAQIIGVRRKRMAGGKLQAENNKDKVCLNLFFDEAGLRVPKFKRNEYVAHEVLQMKPIINKNQAYERFLEANKWVYGIFPNAKITSSKSQITNKAQSTIDKRFKNWNLNIVWNLVLGTWNFVGDMVEWLLKQAQLVLINRHRTTEIITDTQLWFFPDDFEKKLSQPRTTSQVG